jgi:hypothetical protein
LTRGLATVPTLFWITLPVLTGLNLLSPTLVIDNPWDEFSTLLAADWMLSDEVVTACPETACGFCEGESSPLDGA